MTNLNIEEYDDDEYDDDYWESDDWEDSEFPQKIKDQYPGWTCCKMINFTAMTMKDYDQWFIDNVKYGQFKKVGWNSGCSYSVGVVFENKMDAFMFKMRFS